MTVSHNRGYLLIATGTLRAGVRALDRLCQLHYLALLKTDLSVHSVGALGVVASRRLAANDWAARGRRELND
jgi:hypothetical protein